MFVQIKVLAMRQVYYKNHHSVAGKTATAPKKDRHSVGSHLKLTNCNSPVILLQLLCLNLRDGLAQNKLEEKSS